jgi:sporulation protein YabP
MDKLTDVMPEAYGEIKLSDRKKVSLTGIKKLVSFNPTEFLMETSLGVLIIKGYNLEVIKLDTTEGILAIKGKIDGINYMDGSNKNKDNSLLAKLFK